jgi:hypothetical protein
MPPISTTISTGPATYTLGSPEVPGVPQYLGHGAGKIFFSVDPNGNGDAVTYALYWEQLDAAGAVLGEGYLAANGSDNGATEDWHTLTEWGGTILVTGLTGIAYQFKAKARNETAAEESLFSDWSLPMAPYYTLDFAPASNSMSFECTTGNTKISGVSAAGTSGPITLSYTLTNKNARTSRAVVEFSKDGGQTYLPATRSGTSGDNLTGLAALANGSAHTFVWSSCTDLGNSANGSFPVRITPYDSSPTGGYPGAPYVLSVSIDNRPQPVTITAIDVDDDPATGVTWDRDATPIVMGTMGAIMCGDYAFFVVRATNAAGAVVQEISSAETVAGFSYEQDHTGGAGVWTTPSLFGVPAAYLPPTAKGNRIRYEFQKPLIQGDTYTITIYQAEAHAVT